MSVTVSYSEVDAHYEQHPRSTVHPEARSFAVTVEGQLHLFDHAPADTEDAHASSALKHTVAIYAPGHWTMAVRS